MIIFTNEILFANDILFTNDSIVKIIIQFDVPLTSQNFDFKIRQIQAKILILK